MNLPDALLDAACERAQRDGRTVTSLMEEAVWDLLARSAPAEDAPVLPTDGHPTGRLLVDLDDKDAVWALLDADGFK